MKVGEVEKIIFYAWLGEVSSLLYYLFVLEVCFVRLSWFQRNIGKLNTLLKLSRFTAWLHLPYIILLSVSHICLSCTYIYSALIRRDDLRDYGYWLVATNLVILSTDVFILWLVYPKIRRNIPPVCCGRRRCSFWKQKDKNLRAILSAIDKNIPDHIKLNFMAERASSYLKGIMIALQTNFNGGCFQVFLTGVTENKYSPKISTPPVLISR